MAATGGSPGVPESLSTLLSKDDHALCLAEALHDPSATGPLARELLRSAVG